MRLFFISLFFSLTITLLLCKESYSQINFGSYSSEYSVSVLVTENSILDFGDLLIKNTTSTVDLFSSNTAVVTITGVPYLDIYVDVSSSTPYLERTDLTGCTPIEKCRFDINVSASYANRGTNSKSQSIAMNNTTDYSASAQFPIKYRGNAPPGPPPTPVYEGYSIPTEDAFIYIYGSIDIGDVLSGSYTGNISITVNYE